MKGKRFTPTAKKKLIMLIDWLARNGCGKATLKVMTHYNITERELEEWRTEMHDYRGRWNKVCGSAGE